jgi:hypothetical protein
MLSFDAKDRESRERVLPLAPQVNAADLKLLS